MKPATLRALQLSIRHWERFAKGWAEMPGAEGCALCRRFADHAGCTLRGEDCPVAADGHRRDYEHRFECEGTPYYEVRDHAASCSACDDPYSSARGRLCPKGQALAAEEVAYLKSLLPEGS